MASHTSDEQRRGAPVRAAKMVNLSRKSPYVCNQFERAANGIEVDARVLVSAIGLYCSHVLARLSLEEDELFPAARHWLSTEAWFQIAAHCLDSTGRSPAAGSASHRRSLVTPSTSPVSASEDAFTSSTRPAFDSVGSSATVVT